MASSFSRTVRSSYQSALRIPRVAANPRPNIHAKYHIVLSPLSLSVSRRAGLEDSCCANLAPQHLVDPSRVGKHDRQKDYRCDQHVAKRRLARRGVEHGERIAWGGARRQVDRKHRHATRRDVTRDPKIRGEEGQALSACAESCRGQQRCDDAYHRYDREPRRVAEVLQPSCRINRDRFTKGIGWAIPRDRTRHLITTECAEPDQNAAACEQYCSDECRLQSERPGAIDRKSFRFETEPCCTMHDQHCERH